MLREHEGKSVFSEKNIRYVTAFDLNKCLRQIKEQRWDYSLLAHLFLSYHLIWVPWVLHTLLTLAVRKINRNMLNAELFFRKKIKHKFWFSGIEEIWTAYFIAKLLWWLYCMELILDGNSKIGAHVSGKICNCISLRHLFRSTAVTDLKLIFKKGLITLTYAQCVCVTF